MVLAPERIKATPARFDAANHVVEQLEAVSRDGTRIPYFLIRPRDMRMDGSKSKSRGCGNQTHTSLAIRRSIAKRYEWVKCNAEEARALAPALGYAEIKRWCSGFL